MTFDILVPQYQETDEVVKPLLDSIAIQQNVDFDDIKVIICNDGSDIFLSDELLTSYPMFNTNMNISFYFPSEYLEYYKSAANWSYFSSRMFAIPE